MTAKNNREFPIRRLVAILESKLQLEVMKKGLGEIIWVILYKRSSKMIQFFPSASFLICIHEFCKTYATVVITT